MDIHRRVQLAMGQGADPARAHALRALYSEAVLDAGIGYYQQTGVSSVEQLALRIIRRCADYAPAHRQQS